MHPGNTLIKVLMSLYKDMLFTLNMADNKRIKSNERKTSLFIYNVVLIKISHHEENY